MNIAQAREEIARRASAAGYTFDPAEIIDCPHEGKIFVFLRSVRALRTVKNEDGSFVLEEFNSPIIWIDMPSPSLYRSEIDQERRMLTISVPTPQVHILHPEFGIVLPA
jgi:hypothetical protein